MPATLDYWDRREDGWWGHVTRYVREPASLAYVERYTATRLRPR